jgi:primosomal protein N'
MYLVVQGPARTALHRQVDQWLPVLRMLPSARKVRWAVDIDPQNL